MAHAQAYVPVIDINMEEVFPEIMVEAEDSIRNIISGPEPGGVSLETCMRTVSAFNDLIYGYEDGPWASAYGISQEDDGVLPDPESTFFDENPPVEIGTLEDPEVVDYDGEEHDGQPTASLRCLLMSVIEWQKLQINLQIHDMLREYISDAQTFLLTKQLMSHIAAANIEYIQEGQETCTTDQAGNTVCTHRSLMNTDEEGAIRERTRNEVYNSVDMTLNDDNNPQGNYGGNPEWRLQTAREIMINNRSLTEDPDSYARQGTAWTNDVATIGDAADFTTADEADMFYQPGGMSSAVLRHGGDQAFRNALLDPSMSPGGTLMLTDQDALRRALEAGNLESKMITQAGGNLSTQECINDQSDPRCTERKVVNQGSFTGAEVARFSRQGDDAIQSGMAKFQLSSGDVSEEQSSTINQGGIENYQTLPLAQTDVHDPFNRIIQEFDDVINYGYWNTQPGTMRWTEATMLMIYDEMQQQEEANIYVPTGNEGWDEVEY